MTSPDPVARPRSSSTCGSQQKDAEKVSTHVLHDVATGLLGELPERQEVVHLHLGRLALLLLLLLGLLLLGGDHLCVRGLRSLEEDVVDALRRGIWRYCQGLDALHDTLAGVLVNGRARKRALAEAHDGGHDEHSLGAQSVVRSARTAE